jgi:hypothetical protein
MVRKINRKREEIEIKRGIESNCKGEGREKENQKVGCAFSRN